MPDYPFRTTRDFNAIADHLERFCGISRGLASRRLHEIKAFRGLGGADHVVFDFSGGIHLVIGGKLEYVETLTAGGGDLNT
jgi:hypothetical protein